MIHANKGEALVRTDAAASGTAEDKMDQVLAGIGKVMTRMDAEETARKDSDDKVMAALDSVAKRLDACEADMKSRKDGDDKAAKEKEEKERADAEAKEKDEKERADKARKDAEEKEKKEEKEEKERADAAARTSSDPEVLKQIRALEQRIPAELSATDRPVFVGAQMKAERVAQAFGDAEGAPRWMNGETLHDYQRRLLTKYKQHSSVWKDKDLARVDASVLDVAEAQIYADAEAAAAAPSSVPAGTLRELISHDATGRRIIRFVGDAEACWAPFKRPIRAVTGMRTSPREYA